MTVDEADRALGEDVLVEVNVELAGEGLRQYLVPEAEEQVVLKQTELTGFYRAHVVVGPDAG